MKNCCFLQELTLVLLVLPIVCVIYDKYYGFYQKFDLNTDLNTDLVVEELSTIDSF